MHEQATHKSCEVVQRFPTYIRGNPENGSSDAALVKKVAEDRTKQSCRGRQNRKCPGNKGFTVKYGGDGATWETGILLNAGISNWVP